MTHAQAIRLAIAALRRRRQGLAATANLTRYGATAPEVVRAAREYRLIGEAIQVLLDSSTPPEIS